jgi:hypothetical protein
MRTLLIAGILAAGFGLLSVAPTVASPAGGTALAPMSTASPVTNVRCRVHCRHRWSSRRHCWRRCW